MMKLIPDLPANVVGLIASGHVTADDYERVAIPAVEAALKAHPRIRMLYQVPADFDGFAPGAVWDDVKTGRGPYHRVGAGRGRQRCRLDPRLDAVLRVPDAVPGEAVRQRGHARGDALDRCLK